MRLLRYRCYPSWLHPFLVTEDDECISPRDAGTGISPSERFCYVIDDNDYYEFIYKGEAGNSNNYKTKRQCLKACGRMAREYSIVLITSKIEFKTMQAITSHVILIPWIPGIVYIVL